MLGLADQVGGDVRRVGSVVGEDRDLGRAGLGVDADLTEQEPLGGDHVDVAGAGDQVDLLAAVEAVREPGDRLRAAHRVDLFDPEQRTHREHRRVRQAAELLLRRGGDRERRDAGDLRRYDVHHHAGRQRRTTARDVQPDALDRDEALRDPAAGRGLGGDVGGQLVLADLADPADRLLERAADLGVELLQGGLQGVGRDPDVLDPDMVELLAVLPDRLESTMTDVQADRSDDVESLLDVEHGSGDEGVHFGLEVGHLSGRHSAPQVDAANHGLSLVVTTRRPMRRIHKLAVTRRDPGVAWPRLNGMDSRLPLLTVETVIFPGLVLPIPVTDVQGRAVVRDLVENGGELVCGALAVRDGYELGERVFRSLYGTGCAATISEITLDAGRRRAGRDHADRQPAVQGGRAGRRRRLPGRGRRVAGRGTSATTPRVRRRSRSSASAGTPRPSPRSAGPACTSATLPDDPSTLSYLMSAAMTLLTPDRQKLLEATDTTTRLAQLVGLLDTELAAIAALPSLPRPPTSLVRHAPN